MTKYEVSVASISRLAPARSQNAVLRAQSLDAEGGAQVVREVKE